MKQTTTQIKRIAKKTTQVIENVTKRASRNKIIKNIKDFHRTLTAVITLVTNTTDHTNRKEQVQINNKTTRYSPGTRKLNDEYDESYQSLTSRTYSYCDNEYDQLQHSFRMFYAKTERGNGNTRTQNSK